MSPKFALGADSFKEIIERCIFYIDKTPFIREWWEREDKVTLITRPRRFGKTLNMSMLECFFSNRYAGRGDLFEGLDIWKHEKYRALQGTLPVINVSFSGMKQSTFKSAIFRLCSILQDLLDKHKPLLERCPALSVDDKKDLKAMRRGLAKKDADVAGEIIQFLSKLVSKAEGKGVIILLDEYDAPLLEAWMHGYWQKMSTFMRSLFNYTFKSNTSLERGILTGVTRISKESMFSDLNNLSVSSVLTGGYETAFGFTEDEVFAALEEYGLSGHIDEVRQMYDGFAFGDRQGIYNPWSIINYLRTGGQTEPWWANTSDNQLESELLMGGSEELKDDFEKLLKGEPLCGVELRKTLVFKNLQENENSVWSLLVEAGYFKPLKREGNIYDIVVTNGEALELLKRAVFSWFSGAEKHMKRFIKALLDGDVVGMNMEIKKIADNTFSSFDSAKRESEEGRYKKQPELFYHGFMLGLLVSLDGRFVVSSNRQAGRGRYDVALEPCNPKKDDAFILEFKVYHPKDKTLAATVSRALDQIESMHYDVELLRRGIPEQSIHKYGFAFKGMEILIDDKSGEGRKEWTSCIEDGIEPFVYQN